MRRQLLLLCVIWDPAEPKNMACEEYEFSNH